jgi:signal transduction histidine kinase
MTAAADERARLAALYATQLLDTPRERRFDDLVEVAAEVCGTPIAVMNLIDHDRQWGKAMVGLDDSEGPRSESFCAVAIETPDQPLVVHDTHEDPRFVHNAMVVDDPNLRFYAGAPIIDREGFALGTVCVADRTPRELTDGQLDALAALARQAMGQIELRRALEQERESVRRLVELDRLRDQFLSTVSHELRTPLTSIRGWLDLLTEDLGDLPPDQLNMLERVDRNAGRLGRLVDDLLELTRSDAGKLRLDLTAVDLSALVNDAVASMLNSRQAEDLVITAEIAPGVSLEGDFPRLAQVVDNLCSNAAKYTPHGGRVDVRLLARHGTAIISVRDSGIGIPADEREHLFQRFFRASTATDARIPGTGLGLAISKAIVEAHGGSIAVGDGFDTGTAITVVLPLRPTAAAGT